MADDAHDSKPSTPRTAPRPREPRPAIDAKPSTPLTATRPREPRPATRSPPPTLDLAGCEEANETPTSPLSEAAHPSLLGPDEKTSRPVPTPNITTLFAGTPLRPKLGVTMQERYVSVSKALTAPVRAPLAVSAATAVGFHIEVCHLPYAPPGTVEVLEVVPSSEDAGAAERLLSHFRGHNTADGLAPIFVPSKDRTAAPREHVRLLYELDELSKPDTAASSEDRLGHLTVMVVLERSQLALYRARWPHLNYIVLPASGRGIACSRYLIKRICGDAVICTQQTPTGTPSGSGGVTQMRTAIPQFFMLDDNVNFVEVEVSADRKKSSREISAMVALRELQRCAAAHGGAYAAVGMEKLSTAGESKVPFKAAHPDGDAFFYKVFLIRTDLAASVDFVPGLRCAEDIDFLHRLMHVARQPALKLRGAIRFNASVLSKSGEAREQTDWRALLMPWRAAESLQGWECEAVQAVQLWIERLRMRPSTSQQQRGFPKTTRNVLLELDALAKGFLGGGGALPDSVRVGVHEIAWHMLANRDVGLVHVAREECQAEGPGRASNEQLVGALSREVAALRGQGLDGALVWELLLAASDWSVAAGPAGPSGFGGVFGFTSSRCEEGLRPLRDALLGEAARCQPAEPVGVPPMGADLHRDLLARLTNARNVTSFKAEVAESGEMQTRIREAVKSALGLTAWSKVTKSKFDEARSQVNEALTGLLCETMSTML